MHFKIKCVASVKRAGLGCTTTFQTDPPPRLCANWRPWHLQSTLSLSQKVGLHTAEVGTQIWEVSASGLSGSRLLDFLPPWQYIGWDVVVQPGPG